MIAKLKRFYDCDYEVGLLEMLGRILLFFAFALVVVGVPLACFPQKAVPLPYATPQQIVAAQQIVPPQEGVPAPSRQSVDIYGDSRARFFAEGAHLVPGWYPVGNIGHEGCAFLGKDRFFVDYGRDGVYERTTNVQLNGTTLACDTRTYVGMRPRVDIAIVFAGTLLTPNNGDSPESMHSPLEPEFSKWMEDNLVQTMSRIDTGRLVVLDTPKSWDGFYWADRDRINAVDAILKRATARVGGTFLTGFAAWVEAQPKECQPDGSHFSVDCALQAGLWIDTQLKEAP